MAWSKSEGIVSFECDTCDEVRDCDVATVREVAPAPGATDFGLCWRYLQGQGWRSFKRTGRDWTYHCTACGPRAEIEHTNHRRQEDERERIKARNAA